MKKIFFLFFIAHCIHLGGLIDNCMCQWINYSLPYAGLAYRLDFYNLNTGVSCGHTLNTFNGKIFYTNNSGINWIQSNYPSQLRAFTAVQFINATTVYACGAKNGLLSEQNIFNPRLTISGYLNDKFLLRGVSKFTEYYRGVFIKSTDAGISWAIVGQMDTLTGYVEGMHFFNANTGYIVRDTNPSGYPKFYKTINAGLNWQYLSLIDSNLRTENINFLDYNTGFVCGYVFGKARSSIFKTTNGGLNWSRNDFLYTGNIVEVNFFNATTGLAFGSSAPFFIGTTIFRTTNTGVTWDSILSVPNVYPMFVKILNGTGISFASGYLEYDTMTVFTRTYTFKSTDYGLTWITKYFNSDNLISGCSLTDQNNFFISGGDIFNSAAILKSTNGGNVFVNQTGNAIPSSFYLYQNYPNPFNPVSVIKYSIPALSSPHAQELSSPHAQELSSPHAQELSSPHAQELSSPNAPIGDLLVVLKVFDILGREIKTLVNEKQSPGTYEVKFDGSKLSSGIYFYTLIAEDANNSGQVFKETKKLVLLK